jgi:hypothetical protein
MAKHIGNNLLITAVTLLLCGMASEKSYEFSFSTFFGGSSGEVIRDVEADSLGSIYIAGTTRSADFTTTRGAYDEHPDTSGGKTRWGHNSEIFVAKFNLVLFGQTNSSDFPVSSDAYQSVKGAEGAAVIAILSPGLDQLVYSTFLGGEGNDAGRAGCVSSDGSMTVAGASSGKDWPTKNAFSHRCKCPGDAIVAGFSADSE